MKTNVWTPVYGFTEEICEAFLMCVISFFPDLARQLTKSAIRSGLLQKLKSRREEDINTFVNFIMKDSVQKTLGLYLENLKKRKN